MLSRAHHTNRQGKTWQYGCGLPGFRTPSTGGCLHACHMFPDVASAAVCAQPIGMQHRRKKTCLQLFRAHYLATPLARTSGGWKNPSDWRICTGGILHAAAGLPGDAEPAHINLDRMCASGGVGRLGKGGSRANTTVQTTRPSIASSCRKHVCSFKQPHSPHSPVLCCAESARILREKGMTGGRLRYLVEEDAGHHELAWQWRLTGALEYLLGPWKGA